jgi:DNA polymerase I
MYGMGAAGFARATGLPLERARETMDRYFATFPQVAAWLQATEATARRAGRVRTPFGRIRVTGTSPAPTLARNAPIQGAGADMTKLALVETERRLRERFGRERDGLVLVVHDELVAEVPEADADEARQLVLDGMLAAAEQILGDVPAVVDAVARPRGAPLPD